MQMKIYLSLHVLREVVQLFHFGCKHPFETRITSNLVDQPDIRVTLFLLLSNGTHKVLNKFHVIPRLTGTYVTRMFE